MRDLLKRIFESCGAYIKGAPQSFENGYGWVYKWTPPYVGVRGFSKCDYPGCLCPQEALCKLTKETKNGSLLPR